MAELSGSVGGSSRFHGLNKRHDVAVVQMLLKTVASPKGNQFLSGLAAGSADHATMSAIKAFQLDFKLSSPEAVPGTPPKLGPTVTPQSLSTWSTFAPPASSLPSEPLGLITPDSPSWRSLLAKAVATKPDYARLRALPNTCFLYLEATEQMYQSAVNEINNLGKESELEPAYRSILLDGVQICYQQYGIALSGWNTQKSYRRSFRDQHNALAVEKSSKAHPGESLHQWGLATDVGFRGLTLIYGDGSELTFTGETNFDGEAKSHKSYARQNALFAVRTKILEAPPIGNGKLFRIRLDGEDKDPNHFQDLNQFANLYPNDPVVSMQKSLALHLTNVSSSGTNRVVWAPLGNHRYGCDLGLGGKPLDAGTADEIYMGRSSLSHPAFMKAVAGVGKGVSTDLTADDAGFKAAKKMLTDAFSDAERRWKDWTPVMSKDSND